MADWGDGEEVGGVEHGLDWGGWAGCWSRSELVDVAADGGLGWGGRAGGRLLVLDCLQGRRGGELDLQRKIHEKSMIEKESSTRENFFGNQPARWWRRLPLLGGLVRH